MIAPLAALNRGFEKKWMSSIGWRELISQAKNAPRRTTPITNPATISGAPHPWLGASMTAHRIAPSAPIESSAPTGSSAAWVGSFDSGTRKKPRISPAITIGTLTMKIEPHQKCSSRKPPVIGPRPMPSADTPAHTPIALPRSAGFVKTLVMIESVAGMMNAPPTPISARVAINALADGASAESSEPVPKIASPMVRNR